MNNINIDAILNDSVFDCMDEKNKNDLKNLCIKMHNKSIEDALPYIISYSGKLKEIKCSKVEKQAIINVLLSQLNDTEKNKIMNLLKVIGL